MRPQRLLMVGSVLVDLVSRVPGLPPRGGDVVAEPGPVAPGGGFTVLSAAARLGLPAVYGGRYGAGPLGSQVRAALAVEGVGVALDPDPDLDTGYCVVLVEPDGERTFVTVPGTDAALTAADLAALDVRAGDVVYVSGYDLVYPVSGAALAPWCAALPEHAWLLVDPGPLGHEIEPARWGPVIGRADVLTVNTREAALLAHRPTRSESVTVLRDGPRTARVVGADGAILAEHRPPAVRVMDSTGAGDVHTGALLAGLAKGLGWPGALAQANAAAAYAVTRLGPGGGPSMVRP